jgi:glycosyltransferase involved in cell wall biosynthesis
MSSWLAMTTVSAVIATYQRPDSCERALRSVLAQEPAPLEVLVCDDGSTDATPGRFRSWEARDPRVRYVRVEPNRGTPAPARNAGIAAARGDWLAFLDDDDEWLPGKLAAQLAHAAGADVIGTNAMTSAGRLYFPGAPELHRPDRAEILAANPIIQSSALVRREPLVAAGGYPTDPWLRAIEDYAAWLELADRGARFAVLGEPLVRYATPGEDSLSSEVLRVQIALARLAWRGARRRPRDGALRRAALNRTAGVLGALRRRGHLAA